VRRGLATLLIFAVVAVGYTLARQQFNATPGTTTTLASNRCTSEQLRSSWIDGTGAAGTLHAWVKITNTSSSACEIPSHPTLTAFDNGGGKLPTDLADQTSNGQLVDWNDNPIIVNGANAVQVEAGQSVAVALSFVNDSSCSTVSLLRLSWSGGSTSLSPHYFVSQCNGPSGLISRVYLVG
jgi:hypothetical protein